MAFIKICRTKISRVIPTTDPNYQRFAAAAFVKAAQHDRLDIRKLAYNPNENFYLDDWAVSAYEKWGLNENADGFERDELLESHASFVNSWVCLDHNNSGPHLAVGSNLDAVYTPDDYVRVVMSVNRKKAENRHPGLEQKIVDGVVTDTSMGCLSLQSVCTLPKCANVATDETQFCDHVRYPIRGSVVCSALTNFEPVTAGELNRGVNFFENSIITDDEGADCNAKILSRIEHEAKVANVMKGPFSIPAEKLLRVIQAVAADASLDQRAVLVNLVDRLEREL